MSSKLVRMLAYDLAGAFFDNADVLEQGVRQRSARFRAECRDQYEFIAKHWAEFVPTARQLLAHQLKDPNKSQREKDLIYDALQEDRGFASDIREAAPNILTIE